MGHENFEKMMELVTKEVKTNYVSRKRDHNHLDYFFIAKRFIFQALLKEKNIIKFFMNGTWLHSNVMIWIVYCLELNDSESLDSNLELGITMPKIRFSENACLTKKLELEVVELVSLI